jgi:hypothetical protein
MEAGATSLIHELLDSLVVSIVLPKIESLQLKCEVSYTLGSLLVLNKTWSTFIQTREKYIKMLEEWWEGERQWAIHNFYDTMTQFLRLNVRSTLIGSTCLRNKRT